MIYDTYWYRGITGLTQVRKSYLAKQIPQLPALSAIAHGALTDVSPEVVGEGAGTRFLHPRLDVYWRVRTMVYSSALLALRTDPE